MVRTEQVFFQPVAALQSVLDTRELKDLVDSVLSMSSAVCLPPEMLFPPRATLISLCDGMLEMAENTQVLTRLPLQINGINRAEYVAALVVQTHENPFPVSAALCVWRPSSLSILSRGQFTAE
jgi:hypothetical protein